MTDITLDEHRTIHGIVAAERVCRAELVWKGCLNHGGPMERRLSPMFNTPDDMEHARNGWVMPAYSDGIARHTSPFGV